MDDAEAQAGGDTTGADAGGTAGLSEDPPIAAFGGSEDPGAVAGGGSGMSEQDALKQTRTLMDMRETGQALLIAQIADGRLDGYKQYCYAPWQKDLLVEAWAPLVQSAGITVNPWIKVMYAEGISTGPLIVLTVKNRNLRMENDRLKAQIRKMEKRDPGEVKISGSDTVGSAIPAPPGVQTRYDIKTFWKVDDNGFFEYNIDKVYIPKPHRKVKPMLTPENYALLCKHNTKERIDRIYKINEK